MDYPYLRELLWQSAALGLLILVAGYVIWRGYKHWRKSQPKDNDHF
jgi:ABC-type nickel/cobalt efflux system permease component RcnA